jgi:uncharacterized protein with PIN domain
MASSSCTSKFIADAMLGKLAKWLRLIGCDTEYIRDSADDDLVRITVREDRVLLTRYGILANRRMVRGRSLFIESEETGKQLRQVMNAFDIKLDSKSLFTRCIVCNAVIEDMPREIAKDRVPPYVFETQTEFGYCPRCDKVYWKGTHVDHVIEALEQTVAR